MAKEKETSPVVHKLRILVGIGAGVLLTTSILGIACIAFGAAPSLIIANATLAFVGLTTVVGGTFIGQLVGSKVDIANKRKKSRKLLKKISEKNKDKTDSSKKEMSKLVKKYAKLQLKLAKISKTPFTGVFHSNSYMRTHKGTQAINELDAYNLLSQTDESGKSYNKKIISKQRLVKEQLLKSPACKWTLSYDNVAKDASVLDRRTEIACMHDESIESFKKLANGLVPTEEIGANAIVNFNDASKYVSTYARVSDKTKLDEAVKILLNDVKLTCEGLTPLELTQVFPIEVQQRNIEKRKSYVKGYTKRLESIEDIDEYIANMQSARSQDDGMTK